MKFAPKTAHFQAVARVNRFKTVSCYSSIEVMLLFTFSMSEHDFHALFTIRVQTKCLHTLYEKHVISD